jgi:hypothetical protein
MDFYALLDDVLALLRSRGRVSYRALKISARAIQDITKTLTLVLVIEG